MTLLKVPEHMVKLQRAVVVQPSHGKANHLTGREENALDCEVLMTQILEEASS